MKKLKELEAYLKDQKILKSIGCNCVSENIDSFFEEGVISSLFTQTENGITLYQNKYQARLMLRDVSFDKESSFSMLLGLLIVWLSQNNGDLETQEKESQLSWQVDEVDDNVYEVDFILLLSEDVHFSLTQEGHKGPSLDVEDQKYILGDEESYTAEEYEIEVSRAEE